MTARMADASPMDYGLAMHAVFHHALGIATTTGIKPLSIQVVLDHLGDLDGRPFRVAVLVSDVAEADRLGDILELTDDTGETSNYHREGDADLGEHAVEVSVFTNRPADTCPTCRGGGGWQQPDGLIVECPRGCMTEPDEDPSRDNEAFEGWGPGR